MVIESWENEKLALLVARFLGSVWTNDLSSVDASALRSNPMMIPSAFLTGSISIPLVVIAAR